MNYFLLTFRSFFKKGRSNLVKILSLSIGLAAGLILIYKIAYELSYDSFYNHIDRVYVIQTNYKMGEEANFDVYSQTSGAIAPTMKKEIPQIEAATRFTYITNQKSTIINIDNKTNQSKGYVIIADSSLFYVLSTPIISGNAKDILSRPGTMLVSEKVAKDLGGNPIGMTIELDHNPGKYVTIYGIFKDRPTNTNIHFDAVISMPTISQFLWDGSMNWIGNDRYRSYVKIVAGSSIKNIEEQMFQMLHRHIDPKILKDSSVEIRHSLSPLSKIHKNDPQVKRNNLILGVIALLLIITALFNYILIVITTLVNRSSEIATYKCYGANKRDLFRMIFIETVIHIFISLVIAAILIIIFQDFIQTTLSVSIINLINLRSSLIITIIILIIVIVAVIIPTNIFSKISIANAFRKIKINTGKWKQSLLFIQFTSSTVLIIILVVAILQYRLMTNENPGYNYQNIIYIETPGSTTQQRDVLVEQLSKIAEVESISWASVLLFYPQSGNNINLPGETKELFNYAELYYANDSYIKDMKFNIIKGEPFSKEKSAPEDILISEDFEEKLLNMTNWRDGVIGKTVQTSEKGLATIVGVYQKIRVGTIIDEDIRPSLISYSNKVDRYIFLKMKDISLESQNKISEVISNTIKSDNYTINAYGESLIKRYNQARIFRNTILAGGIIATLIMLLGLIAYITNEISRRSSEIAIRKINGALERDIVTLFIIDIYKLAIPSIFIGAVISNYLSNQILQNFTKKIALNLILLLGCSLFVLIIITISTYLSCLKISKQNPSQNL